MKLSIIIPAYNVEKYVGRCLYSVLSQDINLGDYEVIVINDGSTDATLSTIENVIIGFEGDVKVYSQQNAGLSRTRNKGLSLAKGEYVWFVDADDWIEKNCLSHIFLYLDGRIDVLQLQFRYTYDDSSKNINAPLINFTQGISGRSLIKELMLPAPVQFCIYRRNFLVENQLSFYPDIYHEDLDFKPKVLFCAKSCSVMGQVVYNYYQRSEGSITGAFKKKNFEDLLFVANDLLDFVAKEKVSVVCRKFFYRNIGLIVNLILSRSSDLKRDDRRDIFSELHSNRHLFKKMIYSGKLKYLLEGLLFLLNYRFALKMYFLFRESR